MIEKQRSEASWPHAALVDYVHLRNDYIYALGGKLNLFRFFLIQGADLLARGGRFGMIVPLSLLADISTAATRKRILTVFKDVTADCFPQKDNPARRVFRDAKLSTLVIMGTAVKGETSKEEPILVRTYPWNSFQDVHKECKVCLSDLSLLDQNCPIPLVDENNWSLARKIHSDVKVKPIGQIEYIKVTRGEINQTIYREFITPNDKQARLLKGVEVGPYRWNAKLSQGEREWFDEPAFLRKESPRTQTRLTRIATQRITGIDEKRRIVATLINGPCYFADSTNSILFTGERKEHPLYLLGLLNSRLFQWRFKITSTNNNVGTNELEAMPFRLIDPKKKSDTINHDHIVTLVGNALETNERQSSTNQHYLDTIEDKIDRLVYDLYGLTEEEIAIVEEPELKKG